MKRVGKLNNKIVVQGDPNLVKSNQILYKENSNGIVLQERKKNNLENITAGEETNTTIKQYFYRYDKDKIMELAGVGGNDEGDVYAALGIFGIVYNISKVNGGTSELILNHYTRDKHLLPYCRLFDFSGSPSISLGSDDNGVPQVIPLNGDVFKRIEFLYSILGQSDMIPLLQSCFIEITEEEYLSNVTLQLPFNS